MVEFALHPRLAADTALVCDWPLSRILLMNERRFPWLILVPRQAGLTELFDLDQKARTQIIAEIANVSQRLKSWAKADKINVAALGNQVPQIHVHVIARKIGDPAWPNPPWNAGNAIPYDKAELQRGAAELKGVLA